MEKAKNVIDQFSHQNYYSNKFSDEVTILIQSGFSNPIYYYHTDDKVYFEISNKEGNDAIVSIEKMNNSNRYSINLVENEEEKLVRKKGMVLFLLKYGIPIGCCVYLIYRWFNVFFSGY